MHVSFIHWFYNTTCIINQSSWVNVNRQMDFEVRHVDSGFWQVLRGRPRELLELLKSTYYHPLSMDKICSLWKCRVFWQNISCIVTTMVWKETIHGSTWNLQFVELEIWGSWKFCHYFNYLISQVLQIEDSLSLPLYVSLTYHSRDNTRDIVSKDFTFAKRTNFVPWKWVIIGGFQGFQ